MKNWLKWTGVAILLMLLPLVLMIAINAFDDKLDSHVANYGMPRAPRVPDAENGYYAMLAMSAGDGDDGAAYAKLWVEEARAAAYEYRLENRAASRRAKRAELCDSVEVSCFAEVRAKAGEVKAQLDGYKEDLARYDNLLKYRRYEEVLDFPLRVTAAIPPYRAFRSAQKAHLLRAAMAAEAGRLDDAIAAIEREVAFQRVMLAGARTLTGKMIAAANHWRVLTFVSDLMQSRAADFALFHPRLHAMLNAMDAGALDLAPAIETEFEVSRNLFRNPVADRGFGRDAGMLEQIAVWLFYKPNVTIHRAFRNSASASATASLPASRLAAASSAPAAAESPRELRDYIDNPVANILLRITPPDFTPYALRLHDLDAYNRLLALRVRMLAADIGVDDVAEFVAKSEPRYHNPYTMKPMVWNLAARQLGYTAHAPNASLQRFNTAYGRVYVQL
jgi:hypothetical protein